MSLEKDIKLKDTAFTTASADMKALKAVSYTHLTLPTT